MRTLFAVAALCLAAPAHAQEPQAGRALYVEHCAVCHGMDATGGGPMAEVLTVPPADLTQIARRYGVFPVLELARQIDGRDPYLSHGGDMPLFGYVFTELDTILTAPDGRQIVTDRDVIRLIEYLEELQE